MTPREAPLDLSSKPTALIAGGARGIGLTTARLLAGSGYEVFVTSRSERELGDGIHTVLMEPGSAASVAACVELVIAKTGRLDAVIYNVGNGIAGAIEEVSVAEAQEVFEANYWGAVRLVQAVLPILRQQRAGRLVFMSSIGGAQGLPFRGQYCASKSALESLVEALRQELAPLGIHASLISPTGVNTEAAGEVPVAMRELADYREPRAEVTRRFNDSMANGMSTQRVARTTLTMLRSSSPRARYLVGAKATLLSLLQRLLPDGLFEAVVRRIFLGRFRVQRPSS